MSEQSPSRTDAEDHLGAVVARPRDDEHRRAANRALAVSAVGLAVTGALEMTIAAVTGSVGLLGDALHNLADVSTSLMVFVGFRVSRRRPSARYPYGLDRAEDLAGLGVAIVIWVSAVVAGWQSWSKLVHHGSTDHLALGMVGAVIGIVGNQAVGWYKGRVGRRIHSATMIADAKHSWLDALSSVGALIGLVLVAVGFWWGDPIAGFAVTLFIVHVGWEVTSEIAHRLLDGIDPEVLEAAVSSARGVDGVHDAQAAGRWAGRSLTLDVDLWLDPSLPLRDVDEVCRTVRARIRGDVDHAHTIRVATHSRQG